MRRELGKEVRRRFDEVLQSRLPEFKLVKGELSSGTFRIYEWPIVPDVKGFVVLYISDREDTFTIEIAWSRRGRFPGHLDLLFPREVQRSRIPASRAIDGEFRARLSFLFTDRDYWWEVIPRLTAEEIVKRQQMEIDTGQFVFETPIEIGLERVEPLVADAVDKIEKFGVPWLVEQCGRETEVPQ